MRLGRAARVIGASPHDRLHFTIVVLSPFPRVSAMIRMTSTMAPTTAQSRQSEIQSVVVVVVVVVLDDPPEDWVVREESCAKAWVAFQIPNKPARNIV